MRTHALLVAAISATVMVGWRVADSTAPKSCTYEPGYPSAIGRHAFILATATAETVAAPGDTIRAYVRLVPAQVMTVSDVAGYRSDAVRSGLRESGGTAVFVRHHVGSGCGPLPASDGALDTAGVSGLYVGVPRDSDQWIGGRPTFDVFPARHYPLPQRLSALVARAPEDTMPTMTAPELFTLYRTFWMESAAAADTSAIERRIKRWISDNPRIANKRPAGTIVTGMLMAVTESVIASHAIPFGGTFAITVVVAGTDSLKLYGRSSRRARLWIGGARVDRATGLPVAMAPRSYAIDVMTSLSIQGFGRPSAETNLCGSIPVVVDALPIVPGADSTWRGEIYPGNILECAPPGSALDGFPTRPPKPGSNSDGPAQLTFRRHPDGRVTLDARTTRDRSRGIVVHGERISTELYRQ